MYSSNLPASLPEYFNTLTELFGHGAITLPSSEPWFYRPGMRLFSALHRDQAVKRYKESSWDELRTLYSLQIARSQQALKDTYQNSHFQCVCGKNPQSRSFGQLPCTVKSIHSRVTTILSTVSKESPILVIGDDDALSMALAQNGFKDITVFEIDMAIVNKLKETAKNYPDSRINIYQHDVFKTIPGAYRKEFALVTFDPWYAIDGLEAFFKCALNATLTVKPKVLLSFNVGALLSDYSQLHSTFETLRYRVAGWSPLANTYPMPRGLRQTLEFAELACALLSCRLVRPYKSPQLFFSSDLLLLNPIGHDGHD
jgi:hypothetical protein